MLLSLTPPSSPRVYQVAGFDEHVPDLVSLVANTLRTAPLEDAAFDSARDKLTRTLSNLEQRQPAVLAAYRRRPVPLRTAHSFALLLRPVFTARAAGPTFASALLLACCCGRC